MSDQWSPSPAVPAPEQTADPDPSGVDDELAVLDELEADLAAVEQAIESLERVSVEGLVGDEAASRIAAAVSVERFGVGAAEAAPGADA
jgi:hypothetical protein